jgi:1-deoxy-D-xylulose-5-phosphate reductoisomerase
MEEGGLMGAAFNAAKEAALDAFLRRSIGFTDMATVVTRTLDRLSGDGTLPCLSPDGASPVLEDVLEADRLGRLRAGEIVTAISGMDRT